MLNLGKKVSLRLDDEIADKLHSYAIRERVPVSHVLRHMVLRFFDDKEKHAPVSRQKVADPSTVERYQAEFQQTVCALFDDFVRQGYDTREATKRVNFALKAKKHPWATFEVIAGIIRSTGRFRKGVKP